MNLKEVMNELDKIWDRNNQQKLLYPNYSHQYLPENWRVKICTSENNWGSTPGVFIKSIQTGFDWDSQTILIHTEKPFWQTPLSEPIPKWKNDINGISYNCSNCSGFVDREDKFCRYCGKAFSDEIKKGI